MDASDKIQFGLHAINYIEKFFEIVGKTNDILPEEFKRQFPKWFGLTLDDERIFNAVVSQLTLEQQSLIMRFLHDKCKDYERNRFINIVAGMEVAPGKAEEVLTKFAKDGKTPTETTVKKAGSPEVDCRKEFLKSFADAVKGDMDKAYEFCVGGRMIIPDPVSQKALRTFSESVGMLRRTVFVPLNVASMGELVNKVAREVSSPVRAVSARVQKFADGSEAEYEKRLWWKKIPIIGGLFK